MCSIKEEKTELRRRWREIRKNILSRAEKSRRIGEKLLRHPAILEAKTVFLYLSFGTEVETLSLARELLARGKRVAVPLCDTQGKTMAAAELTDMDHLIPGSYGILEPAPGAKLLAPEEIQAALVPALAFDKAGYRLGYGGGYYDKFLAEFSGVAIGVAFSDCVTDALPREAFDTPVNEVVTEL